MALRDRLLIFANERFNPFRVK